MSETASTTTAEHREETEETERSDWNDPLAINTDEHEMVGEQTVVWRTTCPICGEPATNITTTETATIPDNLGKRVCIRPGVDGLGNEYVDIIHHEEFGEDDFCDECESHHATVETDSGRGLCEGCAE